MLEMFDMRLALWTLCGVCLAALTCSGQPADNVNSRYTVESVQVVPDGNSRLSPGLRQDLQKLVGGKFDPVALASLSGRIRRELNARMVLHRLARGAEPNHIKVVFEIVQRKSFELSATHLAYESRQGLSGALEATFHRGSHSVAAAVVSDTDELLERFTGYRLRYDRVTLGTSRFAFGMDLESYHDQWDESTQSHAAAEPGLLYRTRMNLQPAVTFRIARGLTFNSGVSLQHFETQFPAARTEAANSLVNTLRYRRSWEASDASQTLDAAYSLRAATRILDSDYVYARHLVSARYEWRTRRSGVKLRGMAGSIAGQAPLFERFALGDSTTLRGWNKYDLTPLGGNRMAYASAEYSYRMLHGFYDTGAVWNLGQTADVKHALGGGVHSGNLYFSVGFPVGVGRMQPIFLMAMNF